MGSDTLPPCYESVRWIVYEKPVYISQIYFDDLKTKVLGDKSKNN
jgi:carbonic anhydrase